jgi:hypothetical protein
VSAQHGELVTEHQDLDFLGGIEAGEQRQPARDAGKRQVRESKATAGDDAARTADGEGGSVGCPRTRWSQAVSWFSAPTRSGPLRGGVNPGGPQHRRGGNRMTEADQLALYASIPHDGFSRAIRSTSARTGCATGGRPRGRG